MTGCNYLSIIFVSCFILFYHSFFYRYEKDFLQCASYTVTEYNYEFEYNYSNLLKNYGLNETKFYGLPYFGYIHSFQDHTFQGLADHIFPIKNLSKVKCGDIIFANGDDVNYFFKNAHSKISNPYILISHNSPQSMGDQNQLKYLDDPKIIAWFAKNAVGKHLKLEPLPLGLPPYNYSIIHEMSRNLKPFNQRNLTLYLNFSPNTHSDRYAIRKYAEMLYKNDSDVMIVKNWTLWIDYLQHLNNTKFVISPPGAGLDCYRTWEAIIMGAIPIVLRTEISPLYDGLPVMFVDSWTDIKRKNLDKFEQRYSKTFNNGCTPWRPKIWARYWISKIMEIKVSASSKSCNIA